MLSFGSTDGHSQYLDFTDRADLEGNVHYMFGCWVKQNTAPAATRFLFADGRLTVGTDNGYGLERVNGTPGSFRVRHGNGTAMQAVDFSADMSDGAAHSLFYVWLNIGGTNYIRLYFDGVFVSQMSLTTARNTNALAWVLGNNSNKNNGYACAVGWVAYWHGIDTSAAEADLYAAIYHARQKIPRPDKLTLLYKGTENPGIDEIAQVAPTASGSVSLVADAVDAYYQEALTQAVRTASHRLHRRSTEEPVYTARVPLAFMNLEPMDLMNVSHPELPLAASRLADSEANQLMAPWRRLVARCVSKETLHLDRKIVLQFKDHEVFGCTFWSTDRLPGGTNSRFDGLARLDNRPLLIVDRSSAAYLEQPDTLMIEVSQETEGNFIRQVDVGLEKMNHVGFLAEDATENYVLNNCAASSETGWASVANSGTLDLSTLRLFYPSNITTRSFRAVRADNANDTYRHRTFAMVSADAFARLYAVLSEQDADSIAAIQLQRSFDSKYWNNTSGAWQSGAVWIRLPNAYDATRGVPVKHREYSKAIPIEQNENWTVRFGLEGAALPAGGGEVNFGSISCLKGKLIFSEVPTDSTGMLSPPLADTVYHERTSHPQVFPAARGSLTFELVSIQDWADLVTDDELCLYLWGIDTLNYDAVLIQKLSGETARLSYVRYISGSLDARAYYELTMTPGEVAAVQVVWTDGANEDLGEAAYLMRIIVDQVQGVDAHATATHSTAVTTTQIWRGSAPAATGYRRAMNYLRNVKFPTRALPNEEARTAA